jgi:hypothetical protein
MIQECDSSLLIEHLIALNHLINPILPSDRWFSAGSNNEVCDGKGSSFRLDSGEKFFPPISIYSGYMQSAGTPGRYRRNSAIAKLKNN